MKYIVKLINGDTHDVIASMMTWDTSYIMFSDVKNDTTTVIAIFPASSVISAILEKTQ